jgi:hypothetical protein
MRSIGNGLDPTNFLPCLGRAAPSKNLYRDQSGTTDRPERERSGIADLHHCCAEDNQFWALLHLQE